MASLTELDRSSLLLANLDHFAHLVVTDNSTVSGTVQCTTAADAVLDPRASFKAVSIVVAIVR